MDIRAEIDRLQAIIKRQRELLAAGPPPPMFFNPNWDGLVPIPAVAQLQPPDDPRGVALALAASACDRRRAQLDDYAHSLD